MLGKADRDVSRADDRLGAERQGGGIAKIVEADVVARLPEVAASSQPPAADIGREQQILLPPMQGYAFST
jgi:hypothetical protein